jgi:transposase
LDEEIDHIFFEDECMIRDYQAIHQAWFERGKQRKIKTFGKHRGVKLVGSLNYETGEIYCEEHDLYNAEVFLSFLKNILKRYPEGNCVMVLDNARIHHAKLLKPFLEEHKDRLQLMFLPPYSPNLNMIEGLWKWLKEAVIYNVFYNSLSQIRENVHAFLDQINLDPFTIVDRLCYVF